jgi:hypothetical protein
MGIIYLVLALMAAMGFVCWHDYAGHNPHAPSVWDRLWKWVKNRRHR